MKHLYRALLLALTAAAVSAIAADRPSVAKPPEAAVIEQAIHDRRVLSFHYQGRDRLVEPHACGVSSAGEAVLHGYQVDGDSSTGHLPGWRTFSLAKITELKPTDKTFAGPRPGRDPKRPKLDPLWAELTAAEKTASP